jgi:hypothetical protein
MYIHVYVHYQTVCLQAKEEIHNLSSTIQETLVFHLRDKERFKAEEEQLREQRKKFEHDKAKAREERQKLRKRRELERAKLDLERERQEEEAEQLKLDKLLLGEEKKLVVDNLQKEQVSLFN